jgi:nicotinamide riboside kinase
VQDGLREYPDINMRRRLFKMYQDILINSGVDWTIISGTPEHRLKNAVAIVDTMLRKK